MDIAFDLGDDAADGAAASGWREVGWWLRGEGCGGDLFDGAEEFGVEVDEVRGGLHGFLYVGVDAGMEYEGAVEVKKVEFIVS